MGTALIRHLGTPSSFQRLPWARPSTFPPPAGRTDRLCLQRGKHDDDTCGWNTPGGFLVGSPDAYAAPSARASVDVPAISLAPFDVDAVPPGVHVDPCGVHAASPAGVCVAPSGAHVALPEVCIAAARTPAPATAGASSATGGAPPAPSGDAPPPPRPAPANRPPMTRSPSASERPSASIPLPWPAGTRCSTPGSRPATTSATSPACSMGSRTGCPSAIASLPQPPYRPSREPSPPHHESSPHAPQPNQNPLHHAQLPQLGHARPDALPRPPKR